MLAEERSDSAIPSGACALATFWCSTACRVTRGRFVGPLEVFQNDSQVIVDAAQTAVQIEVVRVLPHERFLQVEGLPERPFRVGRLSKLALRQAEVVEAYGKIVPVGFLRGGGASQLALDLDGVRVGGRRLGEPPGARLRRAKVVVGERHVAAVLQLAGPQCGGFGLMRQRLAVQVGRPVRLPADVECAEVVQRRGEVPLVLGIVRLEVQQVLLKPDRLAKRGFRLFGLARLALQQSQVGVRQGQVAQVPVLPPAKPSASSFCRRMASR